jgi:cytochrome P450
MTQIQIHLPTISRAWNDGISLLVAGMDAFARRAITAREKLVDSFNNYLSHDYDDAAEITKEQIRLLNAYDVSKDDIARMQVIFGVALLSNTSPTAFWTLYNIFSQPELLQSLRTELEEHAVSLRDDEIEIDVVAIKQRCTLLLSVFEETQRTLTIHANIRQVMEDTTLENYHLKKGSYVQIPNAPIHRSTELWGANSAVFDARRFVKEDGVAMASSLPPHSFLAWGTAPHLCPARQFASTEILVMAALLVLRVEIEPVRGKWKRPEPSSGDMVTVLPPKKDFDVTVRARYGWERKLNFKMGESKSRVPLASG